MGNKGGAKEPFLLMRTMNTSAGVARGRVCVLSPQWQVTRRAAAQLRVGRQ